MDRVLTKLVLPTTAPGQLSSSKGASRCGWSSAFDLRPSTLYRWLGAESTEYVSISHLTHQPEKLFVMDYIRPDILRAFVFPSSSSILQRRAEMPQEQHLSFRQSKIQKTTSSAQAHHPPAFLGIWLLQLWAVLHSTLISKPDLYTDWTLLGNANLWERKGWGHCVSVVRSLPCSGGFFASQSWSRVRQRYRGV